MAKFVYLFIVLQFLFSSCGRRNAKDDQHNLEKGKPFLLQMNSFFTESEKNVSFPIWFNDSLIAAQKIKKMTRSLYMVDLEDSLNFQELNKSIPREKREYWFFTNGQVKKFKVTYFYDDQEIGEISFDYLAGKDKYGYSNVLQTDDLYDKNQFEDEDMEFPFKIHRLTKQNEKYLAYKDQESGDYLFYMLNSKTWGALSIDSILNPTRYDEIILGTPIRPTKKYRVQNKVNEKDVQEFAYANKSKSVKSIVKQDYPFETKRTILYSKKGICNGYNDSTFSDRKFLSNSTTLFQLDKKNRPVKISHKKDHQLNQNGRISIELFTYE